MRQRPQILSRAGRAGAHGGAGPRHEPPAVDRAATSRAASWSRSGPACSANQAWVGMRAMQHHYRGCGVCPHCKTGWMQLCVDGVKEVYGATGHGAHARYMNCPARTLVTNCRTNCRSRPVRPSACGTGTAWGALQRLGLQGDQTIAIFGQGPVGLSATLLAAQHGRARDRARHRGRAPGAGQGIRRRRADQPGRDRTTWSAHQGRDARPRRARLARCVVVAAGAARRRCSPCAPGAAPASSARAVTVTLDVSPDLLRRQVTLIGSWTFSTVGQAECARYVADRESTGRPAVHPPLEARSGRGGLPAVRQADLGQGRNPAILRHSLIGPRPPERGPITLSAPMTTTGIVDAAE